MFLTFLFLAACATDPVADTADVAADVTAGVTPIDADASTEARVPLQWWETCGDPVCRGWTRDRLLPLCGSLVAGDPCRRPGQECDIRLDGCNVNLRCATTDPATNCPISRAAYKRDIRYLDAGQAEGLRDELMSYRLATWEYRADGAAAPEHLGFIIDDVAPSPAVAADGETVDLYGYTSMTVATLQVQQRQIEALQAKVEALEAELAARK